MTDEKKRVSWVSPRARLSFPYLITPKDPMEGSADKGPKYSCELLFDAEAQADEKYKAMQDAVRAIFAEVPEKTRSAPKFRKNPFLNGDDYTYDGYAGMKFIRVSTKDKPQLFDRQKRRLALANPSGLPGIRVVTAEELADLFAPGCYVRASLSCFAYGLNAQHGNKGISFGLNGLQWIEQGSPLGRASAAADFDALDPEGTSEQAGDSGDVDELFK